VAKGAPSPLDPPFISVTREIETSSLMPQSLRRSSSFSILPFYKSLERGAEILVRSWSLVVSIATNSMVNIVIQIVLCEIGFINIVKWCGFEAKDPCFTNSFYGIEGLLGDTF